MTTVASPGGPSIAGYTLSSVATEISTNQAAYISAQNTYNTRQAQYNVAYNNMGTAANNSFTARSNYASNPTPANQTALNNALSAFAAANTALSTAATNLRNANNAYQSASISYVTSLARQQLLTEQIANNDLNAAITTLGSQIQSSPFDGLTQARYNDAVAINSGRASVRSDFFNKLTDFRYNEAQIAIARSALLNLYIDKDLALSQAWYVYYDGSLYSTYSNYTDNLIPAQQNVINNYLSLRSPLSNAMYQAQANYNTSVNALDAKMAEAFIAASNTATNWPATVQNAKSATQAIINSAYQAAQSSDAAVYASHLGTNTDTNASYTNALTAATEAQTLSRQAGINATGGDNISSSITNMPKLPSPSKSMSMSALMELISSVQLMLDQLSQLIANADASVFAYVRNSTANQLLGFYARYGAENSWAGIIQAADIAYNQKVSADNQSILSKSIAQYQYYNSHISEINSYISAANGYIANQNSSTSNLLTALNTSSSDITSALTQAYKSPPDTRNYFDLFNQDPDLSIPSVSALPQYTAASTIPNFSSASALPAPPTVNYSTNPPTIPSQAAIDAFNQNIEAANNVISQIRMFPQTPVNRATQYLSKLYLRSYVPVRDLTATPTAIFQQLILFPFVGLLFNLMGLSLASQKESDTEDVGRSRKGSSIFQKNLISSIFTPRGTHTTANVGGAFGLTASERQVTSEQLSQVLNNIVQNDTFKKNLAQLLERIGISSGLQALVALQNAPDASKSVYGMTPEELGITKDKDTETLQAVALTLTAELLKAAGDDKNLLVNLSTILPGADKAFSKDEIEQLNALIIVLQKLLLTLLAALTASSAGIPIDALSSLTFGGELQDLFKQLGLTSQVASGLIGALGGQEKTFAQILTLSGLSKENSAFLIFLLATASTGIAASPLIPGGRAQIDVALQTLKEVGVVFKSPPGTQDFLNEIIALFKEKFAQIKRDTALYDGLKREVDDAEARLQELANQEKTSSQRGENTLSDILKQEQALSLLNRELLNLSERLRRQAASDQASIRQSQTSPDTGYTETSDQFSTTDQISSDESYTSNTFGAQPSASNPISTPAPSTSDFNKPSQIKTPTTPTDIPQTPAPPTPITPSLIPNPQQLGNVSPLQVLDRLVQDFNTLPQPIQQGLIQQTQTLDDRTLNLGAERLAALLVAVNAGSLSIHQARLLTELGLAQINKSDNEARIARTLFEVAQEDSRRLQASGVKEDAQRSQFQQSLNIPKPIIALFKQRHEEFTQLFNDKKYSQGILETFFQSVKKLSDYNEVYLNVLSDPAKSIVRDFSIITRSNNDKRNQPTIIIGG